MPRGWASPSTSLAIRKWFLENGEGHAWRIAEDLIPVFEGKGYQPPTHPSIAQIMYSCDKLGLIELIRTEPSKRNPKKVRKIYRLVEEKKDAAEWRDPVTANWKPEKFKSELPIRPTDEEIQEHMKRMREKL